MNKESRYLNVCIDEKERKIVRRVCRMSEDSRLFWQDIGEQIPILIIAFIGSSIFRQHYIFQGMIIAYVWYGLKFNYDIDYFYRVIYQRFVKQNK